MTEEIKADPPVPVLARDSLGPRPARTPELKRYRMKPRVFVTLAVIIPWQAVTGANVLRDGGGHELWPAYISFGLSVMSAVLLVAYLFKYTEIGPQGIRVRRPPRKTQMVTWSELAEVAWVRKKYLGGQDFALLVLSTIDGRQIETVCLTVASPATHVGRLKASRMLDGIKQAWAASGR